MAATLNAQSTTLLLLDLQNGILARLPEGAASAVVDNAAAAAAVSREYGAHVTYVHAALTPEEIAQIPDHNAAFAAIKGSKEISAAMHPDSPATQVHATVSPQKGETLYRKTRFGTFMTGPSKVILDDFKTKGIDTVIIGGVITSGAVLSAVRQLADLDFQLFVLEDCCADYDQEVHRFLLDKIISKQAKVIKSTDIVNLL